MVDKTDSTPVEQLCTTCGKAHRPRGLVAGGGDGEIGAWCNCRCQTCGRRWAGYTVFDGATVTRVCRDRPVLDGTWETHPFLAPTAVPAAPVEATRTAEEALRHKLILGYRSGYEWIAGADEHDVNAYRDAVEARVRASLPSNSDRLREAIIEWHEAREAWAHRQPLKFPESAREMGWTSDEFVERKLAWWAIGERYDAASRKLEGIARTALAESSASATPKGDETPNGE